MNELEWLIFRLEKSGDWSEIELLIEQINELMENKKGSPKTAFFA